MKNIFKCKKCKGQKVRTHNPNIGPVCEKCELPQLIEANKPPRTGRVEKKGDREKLEKELKRINPIKQYLKEREGEFIKRYNKGIAYPTIGEFMEVNTETIKGLIERLVKEEKLKEGNNGEGLPFENSPELYGNARLEAYKNGYNQAKQETIDRLLKLIK